MPGTTFLEALNGTLVDEDALEGDLPENLRDAADFDDEIGSATAEALALKANTTDVNTALALKADAAAVTSALAGKEPTVAAGTTDDIWQGDKTWVAKTALPISTATQAALGEKLDTDLSNIVETAGKLSFIVGRDTDGDTKMRVSSSETVLKPITGVSADNAALLADAMDGGGVVRLTPGIYQVPRSSAGIDFTGHTRLIFEDGAIIFFDDDVAAQGNPLFRLLGHPDYDIELINPAILGTWGDAGASYGYAQGSHFMEIRTSGRFRCTGGKFAKSRFMTMVVDGAMLAHVEGNWLNHGRRDGIRLTNCWRNVVIGNVCDKILDDSIAIHTSDSAAEPIDRSVVVSNNIIRDSQGVVCVGAKNLAIVGNVMQRIQTRAISVGVSPGDVVEGNTALLSTVIAGNVIDTVFDGYLFAGGGGSLNDYIRITSQVPSTNGSGYAEQGDGAGGVVSPYPYLFTNNTDADAPNVGGRGVVVANNICTRNLNPTALYSDYGLGERLTVNGYVDEEVTPAHLGIDASAPRAHFNIANHLANAVIAGNVSYGAGDPLVFEGVAGSAYVSWKDVLVHGNQFANYVRRGVSITGPGIIDLQGNSLNADPLHTNAQRNANGKWDAGNTVCGIHFGGSDSWAIINGNSFRNMQSIDGGSGHPQGSWSNNTIYANPAAMGYDADNIGIGNLNAPKLWGITSWIVMDDDPASATFGKVLNKCARQASAMPTTGKYPDNWFVEALGSAITNGAKLLGWQRITTGSGHTLNTDWVEVWGFSTFTSAAYTPTVSAGSGTITTSSASGYYVRRGKVVTFSATAVITTNGTGATNLRVTLPFAASASGPWYLNGRAKAISGSQLNAEISASGTVAIIRTYNNSYPASSGETIEISGQYECA